MLPSQWILNLSTITTILLLKLLGIKLDTALGTPITPNMKACILISATITKDKSLLVVLVQVLVATITKN